MVRFILSTWPLVHGCFTLVVRCSISLVAQVYSKAWAQKRSPLAIASLISGTADPPAPGEAVTEQLHIQVNAKALQNVRFKYPDQHTGRDRAYAEAAPRQFCYRLDLGLRARLQMRLWHSALPRGANIRACWCSDQSRRSGSRVIGSNEKHLRLKALKLRLRSQTRIHGDETTVQMLKGRDKEATSTSYMWAYRSGEDSDQPIVLLDYQPGRGQIYPQTFWVIIAAYW